MHINPDHFLETPEGRVITPERNAWAWEECYRVLHETLRNASPPSSLYVMVGAQASGKSTWARRKHSEEPAAIVFDAILVKRSEREPILLAAARHRVPVVAVWLRTTLDECVERNSKRSPNEMVNERGLRNVFAALEPPEVDEGFTAIVEVRCGEGTAQ